MSSLCILPFVATKIHQPIFLILSLHIKLNYTLNITFIVNFFNFLVPFSPYNLYDQVLTNFDYLILILYTKIATIAPMFKIILYLKKILQRKIE